MNIYLIIPITRENNFNKYLFFFLILLNKDNLEYRRFKLPIILTKLQYVFLYIIQFETVYYSLLIFP